MSHISPVAADAAAAENALSFVTKMWEKGLLSVNFLPSQSYLWYYIGTATWDGKYLRSKTCPLCSCFFNVRFLGFFPSATG